MSEPSQPPVPPVEPAAGSVPPVEPAAPAAPVAGIPAPRYGEFAPVEAPPAAAQPAAPEAPQGIPAAPGQPVMYSGTAAPQQGYPQPAYPQQQQYPQPGYPQQQYAQPAYPAPGYAQPVYGQPVYGQPGFAGAPAPRRRTWDVVLTIILLVLGLGGMLLGVLYGVLFSSPELLDEGFREQGLGGFDGEVGAAPLVLIASHVVLYLVALGVSILLLVKKKIAFYVPLVAGVVAAIVFWGSIIAVMASDPDFARMSGL
ncbi:MAG: hypothetical protein EAS51_04130 [Microbacteriaceae bacterium]|nr:MAG: hypothetical protein EAS51_04130 [Microbacteriaceae bacterium]